MTIKEAAIGVVAVAAAAVSIYIAVVGGSPKINLETYNVLGAVTAEETAKLLAGKGRVLAMARGSGSAVNPSVEAQLKAFRDALKKRGSFEVRTEKVEGDPMQMMATGGGISNELLFKALDTHQGLAALVLFLGFPPLSDNEVGKLQKYGVKIVLVSPFQPDVHRLLERRVIQMAVVPKPEPVETTTPARTVRERFDQEYLVLGTGGNPSAPAR